MALDISKDEGDHTSSRGVAPNRLNPLQRKAIILVSLGEFIDGYDLLVMGAAILYLKPQFHLSPSEVGWVGAAAYFGAALGLLVFGKLADKLGRRTIFMFNLIFFVVAAILSAFITNIPELFATRFLIGLGVGGDIPTSMSYIAEISPKEKRARLLGGLPQITWILGAAVSTVVGVVLINIVGAQAWRWMFGLAAIPALFVLIGRQSLPESPRWLALHGESEKAQGVLNRFGMKDVLSTFDVSQSRFVEIFSKAYRQRTLVVSTVNFFDCISVAISTLSVPFILRYVGLLSVDRSLLFSGLVWMADLVGALINFWLADRFRRRRIAMVTMSAMGLSGVAMGVFGTHNAAALIICTMAFGFFHWLGSAQCVWAWGSELFPTRIRSAAQGFGNAWCRIAIGLNIFIVPLGIKYIGFSTTIIALSIPPLLNAVIARVTRTLETEGVDLEALGSVSGH